MFDVNTATIKIRLESHPNANSLLCRSGLIAHTEDDKLGIIRQFRKLKVVVICDELEDIQIVQPAVRYLCLALLMSNLRILDICPDCRKLVDRGSLRENYYDGNYDADSYYDSNDNCSANDDINYYKRLKRRNWTKHPSSGIWCVLGPFGLLRILFVNILGCLQKIHGTLNPR